MSELHRVTVWAQALIDMHLGPTWSFGFDNAKRRAGLCNYRDKRITVSRYLAARYDDETNYQTLLHEIAHALAGPRAGHGPEWKQLAADLGYLGGTTHGGETATELAPWVGICPDGHRVYRYRQTRRATSCAICSPRFDQRYLFSWHRRTITAAAWRAAALPRAETNVRAGLRS